MVPPEAPKTNDKDKKLPPCGLYRTTAPMPGRSEQVPAGRLVYMHNHSQQGPPLVLLPARNVHNRWIFHDRGYLVRDLAYLDTLRSLPAEGFYVLVEHLHVTGAVLPERSLVQLGYDLAGRPILFPARRVENTIVFPDRGFRFDHDALLARIEPAGFVVGEEPVAPGGERLLH